jgi:hypothetical protein
MRHLGRIIVAAFAVANLAAALPALAATSGTLPPEQTTAGVSYLTGGIGKEEAAAMKKAESRYPLALEFVGKPIARGMNAEYIADVHVSIAEAKNGKPVLSTTATGPFLMARLAPGKYTVTAEYQGKTKQRTVEVRARKTEHVMFEWNA